MPRNARVDVGGLAYHVLNRANGRVRLFLDDDEYAGFEGLLLRGIERHAMRVLGFCLMPNHWHLVVWPREDGDLSTFMQWLTVAHTQRTHAVRNTAGQGHLYQGRFKSFLVGTDDHLLTVIRYVERNPLRAGFVRRAEDWRWSSLWHRCHTSHEARRALAADGPVPIPSGWKQWVNEPQTEAELEALATSIARARPYGAEEWVEQQAAAHGLISTLRPRGRPRRLPATTQSRKGS